MDHKSWIWRRKSSDKAIIAADKANFSAKENEEVRELVAYKEELEKDLKKLNDKLALALSDCNAKDELVKEQTKIAHEALAVWEQAEADASSLKQELEVALQRCFTHEERVAHLDGALKECMQQLRFVREEQDRRIHDAVMKASNEFEKGRMALEEQLSEMSKKLTKAGTENAHLIKAILAKENVIGDLKRQMTQAEAEYNALMTRLDSTEKHNTSLKYEVRVLEKQLEIRNEEREFNCRTSDVSHKQHLESVKKIAKLESECQRLRLLVRKRLPGPAALAKMKNEVETSEWDSVEMRRKKLNSTALTIESSVESSPETLSLRKRIGNLTKQLLAMEEQNKTLNESLKMKASELKFSRTMLARAASKLSHMESQLEKSSKSLTSREFSLASISEFGSDDKVSCSESWASALISELEHFRCRKQKESSSCQSVGASGKNLMDDFVEMEKLAVVSAQKSLEISHIFKSTNGVTGKLEARPKDITSDVVGKEIVPISENIKPSNGSLVVDQSNEVIDAGISLTKKSKRFHREGSKSICKIIELIEGISIPLADYDISDPLSSIDGNIISYKNLGMPTGYIVRVFQWKTSELNNVLQQFLHVCYDLLNGNADHETFVRELTTALDWIMNHCFSLQDVSIMRDAIKKHYDWDETQSNSEADVGMIGHFAEADNLHPAGELPSCFPPVTASNGHVLGTEELSHNVEKEEIRNTEHKLISVESEKEVLERRFRSASDRMKQLQGSENTLRLELQTLKDPNTMLQDQLQNHRFINSDLDVQLTDAKLKEAQHKILELEEELETKSHCCEELEAKCLELQLLLESNTKECPNSDTYQKEKPLRSKLEIKAASGKLAECQETINNLGKQLKALAAPKDTSDKVITNTNLSYNKITNTTTTTLNVDNVNVHPNPMPSNDMKVKLQPSLPDQMPAGDDAKAKDLKACKADDCNSSSANVPGFIKPLEKILVLDGIKDQDNSAVFNSLAIVPAKKCGSGSLWKMLWRKKRSANKKTRYPLAT